MDKEFNVVEYHIKNFMKNHIVCTRDGRSVRILCTDLKDSKPVVAAVEFSPNCETLVHCYSNGRLARTTISSFDLFFKQINN